MGKITDETLANIVLNAAIDCPHEIEHERVVLKFDAKTPGHNALFQLSRRIKEALSAASALTAGEREPVEGDEVETIDRNPQSLAAWKRHAQTLEKSRNEHFELAQKNIKEVARLEEYIVRSQREVAEVIGDLRKKRDEARADALQVGDQMLAHKFRADNAEARLAEALKALEQHEQGWANVLELDLLPPQHRDTAEELRSHARRVRDGGQADG